MKDGEKPLIRSDSTLSHPRALIHRDRSLYSSETRAAYPLYYTLQWRP